MIKNDQTSQATSPDKQTNSPTISDADYEQLYQLLHAYRFGAISFLELLDAFEDILGLKARDSEVDVA